MRYRCDIQAESKPAEMATHLLLHLPFANIVDCHKRRANRGNPNQLDSAIHRGYNKPHFTVASPRQNNRLVLYAQRYK